DMDRTGGVVMGLCRAEYGKAQAKRGEDCSETHFISPCEARRWQRSRLTGKEKLDQASAGGARAAAGPENSGANCARKESCQEMREGARSGSGVKATGAKPAGAQQQPETRQARSREKGAGALSRSAAVFDALQ